MDAQDRYRDAIRRWNEAEERIEAARRDKAEARRDLNAALMDMFALKEPETEPKPKRTRRVRNRGVVRSRWMDGLD